MTRSNGRLTLVERFAVLERDDFRCRICGIGGRKSDWILEVDHIDGNGKNHDPDNLQTLCVKCHNNKHVWRWSLPKFRIFRFSERRRKAEVPS